MLYNPANWFWLGQPEGQVAPVIYSSAAGALVASDAANYQTFIARGLLPTAWPRDASGNVTTAALDAVLIAAGLPATGLTAPTKAALCAYANSKVQTLLAAERLYSGASVSGVTMPSGVTGILCAAGPAANDLTALMIWGQGAPTATQLWTDDAYNVFTLTGAQGVAFATAALAYGQSVYAELGAAVQAINSDAITTTAEIDALSWPT